MSEFWHGESVVPVSEYAQLRGKKPRTVRDHTATWNRLRPLDGLDSDLDTALAAFCERKGITPVALAALGPRVKRDPDNGPLLVYAGWNWHGQVTAIKYRPIKGTSHDSWQEPSLGGCGRSSSATLTLLIGQLPRVKLMVPGCMTLWVLGAR